MNSALQSLLERYSPTTSRDWENALREIIQELALLGLWRSRFYEHAAFYGGTALRIFHGLPRFSEDMDFSLLAPEPDFDMAPYLEAVRVELASFGFSFEVERKEKANKTTINLIEIDTPSVLHDRIPPSQKLKIKLELDTDPPQGASYCVETLLVPIPFQVKLFTLPSLFAGKLHALLCRNWKQRVKGRDFYDFIWYLGRQVPCDLIHLQKRMEQTGHWDGGETLTLEVLKSRLEERFDSVDFDQAKRDVRPFVRDVDELSLWSIGFFKSLLGRLLPGTVSES